LAGLAAAYARNTNQNTEAIIDLYLKAAELAPRETDKINFQENVARSLWAKRKHQQKRTVLS